MSVDCQIEREIGTLSESPRGWKKKINLINELHQHVEEKRFTPTFASACETKFQELTELFYEKNEQYGDKDPLANFRNGAMMMYGNDSWQSMYETAKCYAMKHVAHIFGRGQTIDEDKVGESLGDLAVYCVMMQFMVEQWKEEEKK